ncbi:transposase [Salmonella enterica subsp. enterica serovar Typhi]|nr:transposase [Salmonella enterica subsp. enterica serovar Typhi]CIM71138.1 transposase [Salmonella enterica subsp. enterica serovar Typhi]CIN38361.1 transposase [Salmonella enterica subsp. enterica serovar Typhi]CIN38376.1 transposase [Salmonella enterica subsp. enterica serovar Typhi]
MKKTRYNDEQTTSALKQAKTGIRTGEICRRMNIFETIFLYLYLWDSLFLDIVSEENRLRTGALYSRT